MREITLNSTLPSEFSKPNSQRGGNLYLIEEAVPYLVAWQWQQRLVANYKAANHKALNATQTDACDTAVSNLVASQSTNNNTALKTPPKDSLLLLQHPPVYTLGTGAETRFLRFDPMQAEVELHRVERGGEVTYHCPGQLVAYPILDLHHYQLDLHWYLRQLEEVIIRTLAYYGLKGERIEGLTGVWLEGAKVAAIGIKVSRWITMHGFALNVCPDLQGFEKIVPCGLEGKPVGSMAQFVPEVSFSAVQQVVIEQFEAVFDLILTAAPLSDLSQL